MKLVSCRGRNGLRRGKPWWRWMIGGHPSMATGVGGREEGAEGLYLGCGPRYSRPKRGLWWSSWSRGGEKIIVMDGGVRASSSCASPAAPLALSSVMNKKNGEDFLFPDALVLLIEILAVYLKKRYVWIVWPLLNNLRRFLNKIYVAYLNCQISSRFWDTFSHVVEVRTWRFDFPKNNYVLIASDSFWCARKFIINSHAIQAYRKICGWLCGSRYGNLHFFILRKDYLNNYQSSKTIVKYRFLSCIIMMRDEKYVIRRKLRLSVIIYAPRSWFLFFKKDKRAYYAWLVQI